MNARLLSCSLALCLSLIASSASAQVSSLKTEVLTDWTAFKATIVKIADAMPEDKFAFKATPAQRTYGEHVLHIVGANANFLKMLGAKTPAPAFDPKATGKADAMKALNESFDYGAAVIKEMTDESIVGKVNAAFLGESTRLRVLYFLLGHSWDTYGQLAVYLRLNGVVPPASQRP